MQVQLEKIPQFLKDTDQFCNWKYELRDGNQTKVPYMAGTTRKASVSDPATFTVFETAVTATGFDGIGIRVHGRIVGIDLDHCIEDGKLLPWAQTIVDRFNTTYIEFSPSGTGVHIFCLLPNGFTYDAKTYYIKKGNIEVYIPFHTNRFLTVTGNTIADADVVETAEALVWLLDTYMRRPTSPAPAVAVPGESCLSDEEVIIKAASARTARSSADFGMETFPGTRAKAKRMPPSLLHWHSGTAVILRRWKGCSGSPALCVRSGIASVVRIPTATSPSKRRCPA